MISEFSTELKYIRNVSETTLSLYGWAFKAFDGALESRATVIERVKKLRDGGLSAVSVNTYLRCINAYFNWLHKEHRRDLIRITKLKEEEKVLVVLTEAHITALIKDKSALHVLICLLLDCGLRIDEALSLAPKDIDLESLQLKVLFGAHQK